MNIIYIVTCRIVRVTNKRTSKTVIGFIITSVTLAHLITLKYKLDSAIVDLHNLQFSVANALGFLCFH
jgi:hypothetical protein